MELYKLIKNIQGKNNEEVLKEKINVVRSKLNNLTEERMCKIYSTALYEELKSEHIPCRLVSTLDLGAIYDHYFVLIPDNDKGYYVADLTYSQFNKDNFPELLNNGYLYMNSELFNKYIHVVAYGVEDNINIEDIYYGNQEKHIK